MRNASKPSDLPTTRATPGGPLTAEEFRTRQVARFELLGFAEALGWPAVQWRDVDGREHRIPAGKWTWRDIPLERPATRRLIYVALQAVEHNHQQTAEGKNR